MPANQLLSMPTTPALVLLNLRRVLYKIVRDTTMATPISKGVSSGIPHSLTNDRSDSDADMHLVCRQEDTLSDDNPIDQVSASSESESVTFPEASGAENST